MDPTIIPVVGIMVPIVLVPSILVMVHLRRRRELAFRERMRALELGHPLTTGDPWPSLVAIAIGAGVPIGAFACALVASIGGPTREEPWIAATFVSSVAVVAGTLLARRLIASRDHARVDPHANGKATFDPDAFDVAGRRG